jgi:hypothetical protein
MLEIPPGASSVAVRLCDKNVAAGFLRANPFIFSVDSTLIQIIMDRNAGFKPVISATITSVDRKYINF